MKAKYFVLVLILFLTSCVREIERTSDGLKTYNCFTIAVEEPVSSTTKVSIESDGSVRWGIGNCIGVYSDTQPTPVPYYRGEDGKFRGDDVSGTLFYAFYPYDMITRDENNLKVLNVNGSPSIGENGTDMRVPMVATTTDNTLRFVQTCGILHLIIRLSTVCEDVWLRGHNGEILNSTMGVVDLTTNTMAFMEQPYGSWVVLRFGSSSPEVDYYLPLPPMTLERGFSLELNTIDHENGTWETYDFKHTFKKVELKRGEMITYTLTDEDLVEEYHVPEVVDLGGSVKWATFNLGASKPEEGGVYYAWGKTEPDYSEYIPEDLVILDADHDAATIHLGNGWRIPTSDEWMSLRSTCLWTYKELDGMPGYEVRNEITGGHIFLPIAGFDNCDSSYSSGSISYYWSSTAIFSNKSAGALYLSTEPANMFYGNHGKSAQCFIRPVFEDVFSLERTSATIPYNAESLDVTVISTADYEVAEKPEWISSAHSGEKLNNKVIHTFSVLQNNTGEVRKGILLFRDKKGTSLRFTVIQDRANARIDVSHSSLSFSALAGQKVVLVDANREWMVSSSQDWCKVSRNDEGSLCVEVIGNERKQERTATVTLEAGGVSTQVAVQQDGVPDWEDFDWTQQFHHMSLFMRFTANWCGYCHQMDEALAELLQLYPGRFVPVSFYANDCPLRFASNGDYQLENYYSVISRPTGILNGREIIDTEDLLNGTSVKSIIDGITEMEQTAPPSSALSFQSSFMDNELKVKVQVYIKNPGDYRITAILIEDGIVSPQLDAGQYYVHNDVARYAFTNVMGDSFTVGNANSVKTFDYRMTLSDKYVMDKLKLLFYIQKKKEAVESYFVDNCVTGKAGDSVRLAVSNPGDGSNEDFEEGTPIIW